MHRGCRVGRTLGLIGLLTADLIHAQSVAPGDALAQASQALSGNAAPNAVVLNGTVDYTAGSTLDSGTLIFSAASNLGNKTVVHLSQTDWTELQLARTGFWWRTDGIVHKTPAHNLQATGSGTFPALLVNQWLTDPNLVITNAGADQRNGIAVLHLQCKRNFASETDSVTNARLGRDGGMDLYLDSATYLPVTLEFSIHPDRNELVAFPVKLAFSDYRDTGGGGKAPYRIQKFLQGTLQLDISVSAIDLNPALTAADFAVPQ